MFLSILQRNNLYNRLPSYTVEDFQTDRRMEHDYTRLFRTGNEQVPKGKCCLLLQTAAVNVS
jgi:hypothetical protein